MEFILVLYLSGGLRGADITAIPGFTEAACVAAEAKARQQGLKAFCIGRPRQ